MKHRIAMCSLLLLALLCSVPLRAQDSGIVTQLQFGRQDIIVPSDSELLFYDFKGTDAISSTSSNNQHSLTVFKPEKAGMSVQITFESIDIVNDGSSYPGKVLVYSGDPDPGNDFAWATTTGGVTGSSLMPEGDVLATLDGIYSGLTYHSTADDGSLGVGVLWRYAKRCDGWVARVKCVTLTDMSIAGVSSNYDDVLSSPKSKAGVTLANLLVTADGILNPDRMTSISFSLPVNEDVIDPATVKVYADGRAGVKGLTPLDATVTKEGNSYRIAFDSELGSGSNWYTLAADILGTAKVGSKVKLQIDGVTTAAMPDGVESFTAAEPVEIVNPALVCMVPGSQTIYVDDTELSFYDEGGIDDPVTAKFSGTTTFIPAVSGKKVQIDFTKVKIGSGSIYYQFINVYNGLEAKAENLIATIRSGETFVARSTAADGALTVEFGDNGTTYTDDGFEATVTLSDLSAATDYAVYVKLESCLGEQAEMVEKIPFTTLVAETVYPRLVADITTEVTEGNEGAELALAGTAGGGMEPLTLTWTDQTGKVIGSGESATVTLTHSMTYRLTVTDARGKQVFDEINIDVLGKQYIATFEDLDLADESHWGGNNTNAPFYSGSFAFDYYHGTSEGYEYWGHFTYANLTSSMYSDLSDQYNCIAGGGVDNSATYGVCYADSYTGATYITVTNSNDGDDIPGMWVTNTSWVIDCIENGDGMSTVAGGFAKDDWYKLTITGLLNSSPTGTVEFYLADFRADREIDRYALDTWQWVDLSSLGKVNKLWVNVESAKKNGYSMTTPAYFCLDNVGDTCPWEDTAEQKVIILGNSDGTLDLSPIFDCDPNEGTVSYSVESPDNIATLDNAEDGVVKIDGTIDKYADEPFMLLAKATQQGRSDFKRVPVRLEYRSDSSGIDALTADAVKVYPVPAHDVLNISTGLDSYSAELIDMQGVTVHRADGLSGRARIDLPSLTPGVYLLRVSHASGIVTRRIIVK